MCGCHIKQVQIIRLLRSKITKLRRCYLHSLYKFVLTSNTLLPIYPGLSLHYSDTDETKAKFAILLLQFQNRSHNIQLHREDTKNTSYSFQGKVFIWHFTYFNLTYSAGL